MVEDKGNGTMNLFDFFPACRDEAVRIITEAYIAPDERDLQSFIISYGGTYVRTGWKEVLKIIVTREVPAELIADKLEDLKSKPLPTQMMLRPGFTRETVLQTFALGLVNILLDTALENGSTTQENSLSLSAQIQLVSQIWKHLKTRPKDDRKITPEEEQKLRETLTSSIIDTEALLTFLKDPEGISTTLHTGFYG